MRRIFIVLLIIVAVVPVLAQETINQLDAQGRKQGEWVKKDEAGKLVYKATFVNDQPVDTMTRFHPNGKKKVEMVFSETSDSASAKMFDQKGVLIAKGTYLNRQKVGEWIYYKSNQVNSSENYVAGKKHGIVKRFYETGELLDEANWKNGIQEGIYKAYTKAGKKYMECMFKNDKRNGWCVVFYPNGEMEMEAFYKDNLRHGTWRYLDEQGNLQYSLEYDNAILLNPAVLDSVNTFQLNEMDKNRGKLIDPEKFMQDPGAYMMKQQIIR